MRRKAFATVQRLVMENAFVAPLAFQFELVGMNKRCTVTSRTFWASRNTTTSGWRAERHGATKSGTRDRWPPAAGRPVILLATFMVFALLKLVPGDIAWPLAGDNATDARITEIRKIYGLDRPFLVQYGAWLGQVAQGDLSQSLRPAKKVAQLHRPRLSQHAPDRRHRPGAGARHRHSHGRDRGDQAQWLGRQNGQHGRLARRRHSRLLAGDESAGGNLAEAELAAGDRRQIVGTSPWEAIRHALLPGIAIAAYGMAEWRGRCADRCWKCCRRNMCARLHAKGLSMTPAILLLAARPEERQRQPVPPSSACWSIACWRRRW